MWLNITLVMKKDVDVVVQSFKDVINWFYGSANVQCCAGSFYRR